MATTVSNADIVEMTALSDALNYYLGLQLIAKSRGAQVDLPAELAQIMELARRLPSPTPSCWASLATGALVGAQQMRQMREMQPRGNVAAVVPSPSGQEAEEGNQAGGEEGGAGSFSTGAVASPVTAQKRRRQMWTEESRRELLQLVEDEDYRTGALGKPALVWSSIARHLGFSAGQVVQHQYNVLKGIEPPSAAKSKGKAAAPSGEDEQGKLSVKQPEARKGREASQEEAGRSAKKAKKTRQKGEDGAAEAPAKAAPEAAPAAGAAAAPAAAAAAGEGWSKEQEEELVKLVQDAGFREQVLGKRKLKWGRLAEHLGHSKKEAKRKYALLTGEEGEEE